jgi:hypothetical protein
MTLNQLHLVHMLRDAGGIPAHGNQRSDWDAGCRFDFENPEHRWLGGRFGRERSRLSAIGVVAQPAR